MMTQLLPLSSLTGQASECSRDEGRAASGERVWRGGRDATHGPLDRAACACGRACLGAARLAFGLRR